VRNMVAKVEVWVGVHLNPHPSENGRVRHPKAGVERAKVAGRAACRARRGACCDCTRLWIDDGRRLTRLADLFDPAAEEAVVGAFDVDELDAHADARLEDAHDGERFDLLSLAGQSDAHAGGNRERLAGADEAAAERDIGGDADRACARFHVDNFDIGGEGKANRIATVTYASPG